MDFGCGRTDSIHFCPELALSDRTPSARLDNPKYQPSNVSMSRPICVVKILYILSGIVVSRMGNSIGRVGQELVKLGGRMGMRRRCSDS